MADMGDRDDLVALAGRYIDQERAARVELEGKYRRILHAERADREFRVRHLNDDIDHGHRKIFVFQNLFALALVVIAGQLFTFEKLAFVASQYLFPMVLGFYAIVLTLSIARSIAIFVLRLFIGGLDMLEHAIRVLVGQIRRVLWFLE